MPREACSDNGGRLGGVSPPPPSGRWEGGSLALFLAGGGGESSAGGRVSAQSPPPPQQNKVLGSDLLYVTGSGLCTRLAGRFWGGGIRNRYTPICSPQWLCPLLLSHSAAFINRPCGMQDHCWPEMRGGPVVFQGNWGSTGRLPFCFSVTWSLPVPAERGRRLWIN